MVRAHIAVIAIALCACPVLAQQPAEGTLTVVVSDQSGARIPAANIAATNEITGARFAATADASGQAVVHLLQGRYELIVGAAGFLSWTEKDVEVAAETGWAFTLAIGLSSSPVVAADPTIPLERQVLEEIPLIPMQQFVQPAKLLRRGPRWF
jgi:hypothetical protein